MKRCSLLLLWFASPFLSVADLQPDTVTAFDRYVKLTEQAIEKRVGLHDFLWLDQHPKEKELIWLGQTAIAPVKTLDQGQEIDVPSGLLQDWLGTVLLEHATLERVRDYLLNYPDYKFYFKQFFTDSHLVKRDGDRFDASLRLARKQFSSVVLNLNVSTTYKLLDPTHVQIICRSTHIGEVVHPKEKEPVNQERPAADMIGYLWRQNIYWRLLQTGDGVYVELESITLTRPSGGIRPSRFLNGFVENYPKEFVQGSIEALQQGFPRPQRRH